MPFPNLLDSPVKAKPRYEVTPTPNKNFDIENQDAYKAYQMDITQIKPEPVQQPPRDKSVLDRRYEILENLGDGHTSRVYLARDLTIDPTDPKCKVAIKVFKSTYLQTTK